MTDRIVHAYDLAQNPLCRHMVALESREGWTVAALSELEPRPAPRGACANG